MNKNYASFLLTAVRSAFLFCKRILSSTLLAAFDVSFSYALQGIQMTTKKKLCNIKGISEAKMEKIKEASNKLIDPGFLTALEYADKRKQVFNITTGSQELEYANMT